jgi:lipopolysaccharide biosynthesis regulator YciM
LIIPGPVVTAVTGISGFRWLAPMSVAMLYGLMTFCWIYYMCSVISWYITDFAASRAMGEHHLKNPVTFDLAEKAEKNHDWSRAAEEYRAMLQKSPEGIEARKRLAEVYIHLERPAEACMELETALDRCKSVEQEAAVCFRLAELTAERLLDSEASARHLRRFIHKHPESKEASYAEERLACLKSSVPSHEVDI